MSVWCKKEECKGIYLFLVIWFDAMIYIYIICYMNDNIGRDISLTKNDNGYVY